VVGRLGNVSGDVEQKDAEAEQDDDADLDLLRRRAEEYRQQQDAGHERRHYDVDDVETTTSYQQ